LFTTFHPNPLQPLSGNKSVFIAVDIGGTSLHCGLIPFSQTKSTSFEIIKQFNQPSEKGCNAIASQFGTLVDHAETYARDNQLDVLPLIGVGTPGKLMGPFNSVISKGSATNLEQTPGEFDDIDMADLLKTYIWEGYSLIINNDAIAQMAGAVQLLHPTTPKLLGEKVAYIGPGTGLGGGFGQVLESGAMTIHTDGHIYDISLDTPDGGKVKAEDVLSGRAFEAITGLTAIEVNNSSTLLEKYRPVIEQMGRYLGQLIERLVTGNAAKIDPENNWPSEEVAWIQDIHIFLLGGSIGTIGDMALIIQNTAIDELEENDITDITFIPIPDTKKAALIGTVSLIPTTLLQDYALN